MLGVVTEAPDKAPSTRCLPNFNVNVKMPAETFFKFYFFFKKIIKKLEKKRF